MTEARTFRVRQGVRNAIPISNELVKVSHHVRFFENRSYIENLKPIWISVLVESRTFVTRKVRKQPMTLH